MEENKSWLYFGVFLNKESQGRLITAFKNQIPEGWKTYAHHMTIAFHNKSLDALKIYDDYKNRFGEDVTLIVTHLGISNDAIAVKVQPPANIVTLNAIPHITLATPMNGKPVNSNYITNWIKVEEIPVRGKIDKFSKF